MYKLKKLNKINQNPPNFIRFIFFTIRRRCICIQRKRVKTLNLRNPWFSEKILKIPVSNPLFWTLCNSEFCVFWILCFDLAFLNSLQFPPRDLLLSVPWITFKIFRGKHRSFCMVLHFWWIFETRNQSNLQTWTWTWTNDLLEVLISSLELEKYSL